jgi:hypothetical protein
LDKKAKQDIEIYYRTALDDKEKLIGVLRQQSEVQHPQSPAKSEKDEELFTVNSNNSDSHKAAESDDLKDKIKRLELLLLNSKKFMKTQTEKINVLNEENENLKKGDQSEQFVKLEQEFKKAEVKINELVLELNGKDVFYNEQIKKLEADFMNKEGKLKMEIDEINKKMTVVKVEGLEDDYEMKIKSIGDGFAIKLSGLESDVVNLKHLNEILMNKILELEELNRVNSSKLEMEVENMKNICLEKDAELEKLRLEVMRLEQDVKLKNDLFNDAQSQLEVLKFQIDKLNEEKKNYEKFIEDFSLVKVEYEQKYQTLNAELSQLKDNKISDNEMMNQYEIKVKELKDEICRLDEERDSCLQNEKENYTKLAEDFNQYKDVENKKFEIIRLTHEVSIFSANKETKIKFLNIFFKNQVSSLEAKNIEYEQIVKELKESKLADNERLKECDDKLVDLEIVINKLNEERNNDVMRLNTEKEKLLEEFNQLKDEDYKIVQEKLELSRIQVENLNQNNEKLRSDFEVIYSIRQNYKTIIY